MVNKIFIGGCSRSGTTLLGGMLAASELIYATPESQFKFDLLEKELWDKEEAISFLKNHMRLRHWDIDLNSAFRSLNEQETGKTILEILLNEYRKKNKIKKELWVDHSPNNLEYIQSLNKNYPNSKFIFIIRDGRAVMNSLYQVPWGPKDAYEASRVWVSSNAFGLAAQRKFPEVILILRYEDLIIDTENVLMDICEFLEIPFSGSMIRGNKSFLPKYTSPQHSSVGTSPDKTKINNWKEKLSRKNVAIFEDQAKPLLENFGYELLNPKVKIRKGDRFLTGIETFIKRNLFYNFKQKAREKKSLL